MKICNICGEEFENGRIYSNHVRWKHKSVKHKCKFCGREFSILCMHESECIQNPLNVKYCKQCGKQLLDSNSYTKIYSVFCTQSCATSYNNKNRKNNSKICKCSICGEDFESFYNEKMHCDTCRPKIKNTRQGEYNKQRRHRLQKGTLSLYNIKTYKNICPICGKDFVHYNSIIKTCSRECYKKLLSEINKANPNCGGETNYKKFRYNGIYMDSSWELDIAVWMDAHNIEWIRSRKIMFWWTDVNGKKRRYYPDFYLPFYDLYLDPKNKYLLMKDDFKLKQVIADNHIKLIYGHKTEILDKLMGL